MFCSPSFSFVTNESMTCFWSPHMLSQYAKAVATLENGLTATAFQKHGRRDSHPAVKYFTQSGGCHGKNVDHALTATLREVSTAVRAVKFSGKGPYVKNCKLLRKRPNFLLPNAICAMREINKRQ